MATFIMSYPGPTWRPHGSADGNPRAALEEWLQLCDHIVRAGGRILVLDPPGPPGPPGSPGPPAGHAATADDLVYAAHLGALFPQPQDGKGAVFLRWSSTGTGTAPVAPPAGEATPGPDADYVGSFLSRAGLAVRQAEQPFSGQADVIALNRNRFILTFGSGTRRESVAQVRPLLPQGARVMEVELNEGFPHGSACLCQLVSPGGDHVLLIHGGAMARASFEEVTRFAGDGNNIISLEDEDALAHACTALSVRGTVLLPSGLSTSLRGLLVRHGLTLVEVDLPQLLGRGGGGPRTLVNDLPGYVLSDEAPSYTLRREELMRLPPRYPESHQGA